MKASKYFSLLIVIFLMVSFLSCEKIIVRKNEKNSPVNNFNQLWNTLDQGYVYFDYKNVNWDSVKAVYEPMIYDSMSEDDQFNLFANMLETLRDGHVSIRRSFIDMRSYDFTEGYLPNFNKEFVINQYLTPNDMDTTTFIRHCFLNQDIGYLYYSTFTNEITLEGMNEILSKYANTKGLIIDVRGNLGGDATNIDRLMEHFISKSTLVGYSQEKIGPEHNDLSEKKETIIEPNGSYYDQPIIILTNRACFSACNAFVAYMSLLPNVKIIGDITGGGAGLPVANQLWNGWFFSYSSTIGMLPNGFITENGIEPDIQQYTDENFENAGVDNIIETAIIELQ